MKITTAGTQKESQIVQLGSTKAHVLHYDPDYDATHPEESLRDFIGRVKGMISRYEYNKSRTIAVEAELVDLYHYIEMTPFKNVPDGYRLYRKLAELRRERRACKNENDLLQPIYDYFHATEVLNKLSYVQGECAKCKSAIDARTYLVRTDILDEYFEAPARADAIDSDSDEKTDDILDHLSVLQDGKEEIKNTKDKPMSAFKPVWRAAN